MTTIREGDIVSVIMFGRTQTVQVQTVNESNNTFDFVDPLTGESITISFKLIWNFMIQTRITEGLYEGCWGNPHYAQNLEDAIEFATFNWRNQPEVKIIDNYGTTVWTRNEPLNCSCGKECNSNCETMNLEFMYALPSNHLK